MDVEACGQMEGGKDTTWFTCGDSGVRVEPPGEIYGDTTALANHLEQAIIFCKLQYKS
jgi:hypothetical protein